MKKTRENDLIFYVISDKKATLNAENVAIINAITELHYDHLDNVSYEMLRNDRLKSFGGNHAGMFRKKDGLEFLIFPTTKMGFTIDEGNTDIKEYSYNEFKGLVWDIEEEIEI
jgi:hypothetical protein